MEGAPEMLDPFIYIEAQKQEMRINLTRSAPEREWRALRAERTRATSGATGALGEASRLAGAFGALRRAIGLRRQAA
jgi:hypothetical protein